MFLHVRGRRGVVTFVAGQSEENPKFQIFEHPTCQNPIADPCRKKHGLKKMNMKEHFGTTRCRSSLQNVSSVSHSEACRIWVAWQNVEREVTGLKMRLASTFWTADLADWLPWFSEHLQQSEVVWHSFCYHKIAQSVHPGSRWWSQNALNWTSALVAGPWFLIVHTGT